MKVEVGKRYLNDCTWRECEVEGKRGFMIFYFYIDDEVALSCPSQRFSKDFIEKPEVFKS